MDLSKCEFLLIRQDPPFNLQYISTTYILDNISRKVKIINNPTSIRNISEKLYSVKYLKFMPDTIFSQNIKEIKNFFKKVCKIKTTEDTENATIIQTRHRIPEKKLSEHQILVYQVPQPEPLRRLEPKEQETRKLHAYEEYALMHVKLYEEISHYGSVIKTYAYPVRTNRRYITDPSPTPKFDNPKMDFMEALQLFGAGRERRIYAIPPYTSVKSLDFEDHPFEIQTWDERCDICGSNNSYLDEIIVNDKGEKKFICSDTNYCEKNIKT